MVWHKTSHPTRRASCAATSQPFTNTGGNLSVCWFNHSRIAHSWSFAAAAHINGTLNADHCKRRTSLGISPPGSTCRCVHNSVTGFPVHCTSHSRHSLIVTIWPWATVNLTNLNLLLGWSTSPHVSVSEASATWISRPGSRISSWANSAKRLPIGMGALCCRGHVLAASQLTKTDGALVRNLVWFWRQQLVVRHRTPLVLACDHARVACCRRCPPWSIVHPTLTRSARPRFF